MQSSAKITEKRNLIERLLALPFIALVKVYQLFISPVIHVLAGPYSGCRFHPNCSAYAVGCLKSKRLLEAFGLIIKRFLKCHPGHPGGNDPIPD